MEAQATPAQSPATEPAQEPLTQARREAPAAPLDAQFQRWAAPQFALPLLTLVCLAAFFVNLGGYPLYTKGEPREAVTVLDMFRGHSIGSFLLPMRAGVELPSKPLLMHWLIAATSMLTGGVGEWTVRLPSAIMATLAVLCCYLYVRRLFNASAGLFSALILAANFQFLQAAGGARVDMTLTFFMEIAFFEFLMIAEGLTPRRTPLYLAVALAVLAKGPVGLVLPAAVALVFVAAQGRWNLLADLELARGALIVGILAGGWYLAAIMVGGRAFFDKQILAENVFTFLHHHGMSPGHGHRFYYVELVLLAGFLPWSLLLPPAALYFADKRKLLEPRALYVLIWFGVVLLFYNVAAAKRGVYLLALYPALAVLLGLYLADELGAPRVSSWTRFWSLAMGIFFGAISMGGLIAAGLIRIWPPTARAALAAFDIKAPRFVPELSAAIGAHWIAVMAIAAVAGAVAYLLLRTPPTAAKLVCGTAVGVACLSMVANLYVLPATANTIALKDFAQQLARTVGKDKAAYLFGLNYDIAFYSGDKVFPVVAIDPKDWPDYLILGEDTYQVLAKREMSNYIPVLRSGPTYLDGSGEMILARRKR